MENVREIFFDEERRGSTLGAYEARIAGSNKLKGHNSRKGGCANLIVEIHARSYTTLATGESQEVFFHGGTGA